MTDLAVFDHHFRQWAHAACVDWGYPPPDLDWFTGAHARLPAGLRTEIGRALSAGAIDTVEGHRFVVAAGGQGPYSWFSRNAQRSQPAPNWEYFVHVAEYARVLALTENNDDLQVGFEDQLMDISVRRGSDLLWYIEVKETFQRAHDLSRDLDRLGAAGVDFDAPDRGDDALRTAKRLLELRPLYLSLVGIGGRLDFSTAYRDQHHFDLVPDLVPVGATLD